jgi:ABC-type phosphate/phosphonate transport system substrate-binding protein
MAHLEASLPMYGPGVVDEANAALWAELRERLAAADDVDASLLPESLSSPDDEKGRAGTHGLWLSPQLLMSQTCGGPLVTALCGQVSVVGTPCYSADGCVGSTYSSLLITRRELTPCSLREFRASTAAINSTHSLSGYTALMAAAAAVLDQGQAEQGEAPPRLFFRDVVATGGHQSSVEWVADGRADVAAIDCVTFGILQKHRQDLLENIEVFGRTPQLPGLPIICSLDSTHLGRLQDAWLGLVAEDRPGSRVAREALLLQGFEPGRGEQTLRWYEEEVGKAIATAGTVSGRVTQQQQQQRRQQEFDLGSYSRTITTSSPEAQAQFDLGLMWTFGFNHEEALRCFEAAASADPKCAMADWGQALVQGPFYNKPWKFFGRRSRTAKRD